MSGEEGEVEAITLPPSPDGESRLIKIPKSDLGRLTRDVIAACAVEDEVVEAAAVAAGEVLAFLTRLANAELAPAAKATDGITTGRKGRGKKTLSENSAAEPIVSYC